MNYSHIHMNNNNSVYKYARCLTVNSVKSFTTISITMVTSTSLVGDDESLFRLWVVSRMLWLLNVIKIKKKSFAFTEANFNLKKDTLSSLKI